MDYAVCLVVGLSAVSVIKYLCSWASSIISEDRGFRDKVKGTVFFFISYASVYWPVFPLSLRHPVDETFVVWAKEANVSQNMWSANEISDTLNKYGGGKEVGWKRLVYLSWCRLQAAGCEAGDAVGDRAHWANMRTRVRVPNTYVRSSPN